MATEIIPRTETTDVFWWCTKCKARKPLNQFRTVSRHFRVSGHMQPCIKCCSAYKKHHREKRRESDPEAHKKRIRAYKRKVSAILRHKVLKAYGQRCKCCGTTIREFLCIDHINNDGAAHRRELKESGNMKLYEWLIKHDFPKDRFQLLCHNCNSAKGFYGECPHERKRRERINRGELLAKVESRAESAFCPKPLHPLFGE